MTSPALLGDLLDAAGNHLQEAAGSARGRQGPKSTALAARQAARAASALSRYLDDIGAFEQPEVLLSQEPGSHLHAAVHARHALQAAETRLRTAARQLAAGGTLPCRSADELAAAVACLTAGRDLLATHFRTGEDGAAAPLPGWGPLIRSAAVTGALLERTGRLARQLTNWASKASYAAVYHSAQPGTAARELDGGRYWLTLADSILTGSRQRRPVTAADRTLLAAIPATGAPERQRPVRPEPQPVLCEAITATAMRLRAAPGSPHWPSPTPAT
jgi:hypothetical protein